MEITGNIWKYGDHVDTDVIIPARYLNTFDPKVLAAHCMEDLDPEFASRVRPGDFLVGGWNFGCGSSREHAPLAIKACGIRVVIAAGFARIFYRNAINVGLPVLEIGKCAEEIQSCRSLRVNMATGTISDVHTARCWHARPLPGFIRDIAAAGGLIAYVKGGGLDEKNCGYSR